ncbi:MAG: glycosyltransferase family 4 protein [Lachnospiraceae bacterium]|nr:glycosyltransferase family 4 protein [Lachnospiraceae bacterium]
MKIVFFSGNITKSGGTERVLSIIANGLVKRGYEIVIFSLTGNGVPFYDFDESIRIRPVGSRGLETDILSNIKTLCRFMKEEKPDFIIDVDIILCFYTGLLKFRFPKTHWISWEHFNYYYRFPVNHNLRKIARFIVSRFSECLVVLSDEDKGYYQSNLRLKCRIKRIYNPTPFEEDFAKTEEKKVVLAAGRLVRIKGFDMLLKSWKPVEKKHPDWILKIAGDGEERENLEKEKERLGLKNVEFLGMVEDMRPYYKEAAFFVLPSRDEGFVMVLLEAMKYSLPAVAFMCKTGVKEVVQEGINGYVAKLGDMKTLARKMDLMIGDDDKRHAMGLKAKELISRFNQEGILDEWEKLLISFD